MPSQKKFTRNVPHSVKFVKSEDLQNNPYLLKNVSEHAPVSGMNVVHYIEKHFKKDTRILNIGCGAGQLEEQLLMRGYTNLEFCDVDQYMSCVPPEYAAKLRKVNLNHEPLPYKDAEFDLVVSIHVLEHLENPFHFARECRRVMRKNATLVVAIPITTNIWERLYFLLTGNSTKYTMENNHILFFSKNTFIKPFAYYDLKLFKQEYDKGTLPFIHIPLPAWSIFGIHTTAYFKKTK